MAASTGECVAHRTCPPLSATILEVGEWGLRRTTWDELELVQHWKAYLDAPGRYLRHVLDD